MYVIRYNVEIAAKIASAEHTNLPREGTAALVPQEGGRWYQVSNGRHHFTSSGSLASSIHQVSSGVIYAWSLNNEGEPVRGGSSLIIDVLCLIQHRSHSPTKSIPVGAGRAGSS
jgi:hypothetical protein